MEPSATDVKDDEFAQQIGDRVRFFRKDRNLSLSELSRRSGIAKATLSNLEAGNGNPTVLTLGALASVLKLTPGDFIDPPSRSRRIEGKSTLNLAGPGIQMVLVHRIAASSSWDIYEATLPEMDKPLVSATHAGTEHLFMIDGEAQAGPTDQLVTLVPGDAISFSGQLPHSYFPITHPCKMLILIEHANPRQERSD